MLPNDPLADVLYVDLSKRSFRVERREDLFADDLGGAGAGIRLLAETCPRPVPIWGRARPAG